MKLGPGKVAFVTGGAGGIGAGTARMLGQRGVTVVSFDVDGTANRGREGSGVYAVDCDCADCGAVRRAFEGALERFGRVDILVNNVGSFRTSSFLEEDYGEAMAGFEEMLRSCAGSTYAFTQLAAPVMAAQGAGAIINVLTNHVHRDICRVSPEEHAYDAAKYAQLSLNKGMAAELHDHGIRVNAVDPAATMTKMLKDFFVAQGMEEKLRRRAGEGSILTPEEVGLAICHLIEWEDPAPVGQNYLLRTRADCEGLKSPKE